MTVYIHGAATAKLSLGDLVGARASVDEALLRAETTAEQWWQPELHRLMAEISAAMGEDPAPHLRTAVEIAARQGSKLMHQRAEADLAAAQARSGELKSG